MKLSRSLNNSKGDLRASKEKNILPFRQNQKDLMNHQILRIQDKAQQTCRDDPQKGEKE
jgi:hypothetical protein